MRLLTTHSRLSGSAPAAALRFQIRRGSRSIASSVTSSSRLAPRPTISSRFASSATTTTTTTTTTTAQNPSNSVTNSSASTIFSSSSRPRFQTAKHMSFFKNLFSSSASSETMAKASEKAQKLIDENNVVVFSKSWCSFSRSTKKTLNDLGAEYKLVELDQESDGDELQDALQQISGQRTVPNVFISQKHIGGNSDVQGLNSQRQLAPLLKSAGAIAA